MQLYPHYTHCFLYIIPYRNSNFVRVGKNHTNKFSENLCDTKYRSTNYTRGKTVIPSKSGGSSSKFSPEEYCVDDTSGGVKILPWYAAGDGFRYGFALYICCSAYCCCAACSCENDWKFLVKGNRPKISNYYTPSPYNAVHRAACYLWIGIKLTIPIQTHPLERWSCTNRNLVADSIHLGSSDYHSIRCISPFLQRWNWTLLFVSRRHVPGLHLNWVNSPKLSP